MSLCYHNGALAAKIGIITEDMHAAQFESAAVAAVEYSKLPHRMRASRAGAVSVLDSIPADGTP